MLASSERSFSTLRRTDIAKKYYAPDTTKLVYGVCMTLDVHSERQSYPSHCLCFKKVESAQGELQYF